MDTDIITSRLWKQIFPLYKLAELGAYKRTIKVSTEFLAEKMSTSQQTASRHLIKLEQRGWISRQVTPEGCLIKITDAGFAALLKLHSNLLGIMETKYPPSVTFEGVVFSGLGEGAYYVSRDGYRRQFIEKLGFDPYPGTLNIRLVSDYDVKTRNELETYPAIEFAGFVNENRTYGPVKCFPAIINNKVKGAVIFALRSHYDSSVVEAVAPMFLRNHLKLKDGHKVKIEVLINP